MSRTAPTRLIRSKGYATVCMVVAGVLMVMGVFAVVDPQTRASGDRAWLGWTLLGGVLAFVVRAWFIGVELAEGRVVRHGWLRNTAVDRGRVAGVGSANYSGIWLIDSSLFAMVVLRLDDGSEVEVPELAGRHKAVWRLVDQLQIALGVVPTSSRGEPE